MAQSSLHPRDDALFSPPSWVKPKQIAQISEHLNATIEFQSKTAGRSRVPARRIVVGTARRLARVKQGRILGAIFLACSSLEVLTSKAVLQQVLATQTSDGTPLTHKHLAERLLAVPGLGQDIRRMVVLFAVKMGVLTEEMQNLQFVKRLLTDIVGPSVRDHLRRHVADDVVSNSKGPLLKFLVELHGGTRTAADIARDLNWSTYAAQLFEAYFREVDAFRVAGGPSPTVPASNPVAEIFDHCLKSSDVTAIGKDAAERGAVVLQTHIMFRGITSKVLYGLGLPLSLIGNVLREVVHPGDYHISTLEPETVAMRLARLVKLHRKGPRITRIFPDGKMGTDFASAEILGKRVQVAMGGAAISYFGRAPLYFSTAQWDGNGVVVQFVPGPQLADCPNLAAARAEYLRFYCACVTDQIKGSPRNFYKSRGILAQMFHEAPQ